MYFDLPFPASSLQHSWLRDKESNLLVTKVKGALDFVAKKTYQNVNNIFFVDENTLPETNIAPENN